MVECTMNFETFLKKNLNTRKLFGKQELQIITKQRQGIALTQSEKNRLSRDIRPKFDFIKECSIYQKEFEIKKDAATEKIIQEIVTAIMKDKLASKIQAILLFGSHVTGRVTFRSDIDIAVVFTDIDTADATKFRMRISGESDARLDIQVFNLLPQKIKRAIARKHTLLYKAKEFDNLDFTIYYLKDEDYFIRMAEYGETA